MLGIKANATLTDRESAQSTKLRPTIYISIL